MTTVGLYATPALSSTKVDKATTQLRPTGLLHHYDKIKVRIDLLFFSDQSALCVLCALAVQNPEANREGANDAKGRLVGEEEEVDSEFKLVIMR